MMALNTNVYENFRNALEQRCFRLIIDAYHTSSIKPVIQLDWNENDISSELHEHITSNPLRTKWRISTNVESHIAKETSKVKGFSNKFPRIDFRLTSFISSNEYEYFFEAKNLKENNSALKRRYINTGIDSFVSKKYSNGSIIGYLLEGDEDKTVKGINSLLMKDDRNKEALVAKSSKLHKAYYESKHTEIGILKHFILNFAMIIN